MNIYSFYHRLNVPVEVHEQQLELIDIWKVSWRSYGWNPIVLSLNDIESHPVYSKMTSICETYPTVNNKDYELMCYLRWLYMDLVGGWFTDYDIINYGFLPQEYGNLSVTTSHQNMMGGSTVYGTKEFYKHVIDTIMSYTIEESDYVVQGDSRKAHISDMYILSKKIKLDKILGIELGYGVDGYENSQLVHYANDFINRKSTTRKNAILKDPRSQTFL